MRGSGRGDFAAKSDFNVVDDGTLRQLDKVGQVETRFEIDIVDDACHRIVKVTVLGEVRTVARGFPFEIDLADDAVLHQGLQAVVNRGQRDIRQTVLHPHVNLIGRRVIALLDEIAVDLLPLTRHAQPSDFLRNHRGNGMGGSVTDHRGGNLGSDWPKARMILILITNILQHIDNQCDNLSNFR